MRHIRSILYAAILAPATWVLTGVGLNRDLTSHGHDRFAVESFTGLLLLLLAGTAYGILLLAPISPAGPALAGAVFAGTTIWALVAPTGYAALWPANVAKDGFDLSRPGYGLAALLAIPLLCTALSARRWAKYEPPVLPFIGQIGRARGSAPVAGTPMAVLTTTVLPATQGSARPAQASRARPDRRSTVFGPPSPGDQPTTAFATQAPAVQAEAEATTALPAQRQPFAVQAGGEMTTILGGEATTILGGEATTTLGSEEATTVLRLPASVDSAETTVSARTSPPALPVRTPQAADERTTDLGAEEATTVLRPEKAPEKPAAEGPAEPTAAERRVSVLAAEEPTIAMPQSPAAPAASEPEETAEEAPATALEPAAPEPAAAEDRTEAAADDEEKTQVVRLPDHNTKIIPQVSGADAGEATQVIPQPKKSDPVTDDEQTRVMTIPAQREPVGE